MRIDRLRFAMALAQAEITVTALSARIGISRATLSAVRGGKSCSQQTAEKIAAGLEVPLATLITKNKEACEWSE